MEAIFAGIYQRNDWGYGSGWDSLPQTTTPYRRFIEDFIVTNNIRSVLDIGCGDWQFSRLIDWGGADYVGMDVVRAIVEANTSTFGRPGVSFVHLDALGSPLPPADLVLIKDVLQHWTNGTIEKFLERLTVFHRVLITNSTVFPRQGPAQPYADIDETGKFRPLDVRLPPFRLPAQELLQYNTYADPDTFPDTKTVLLWLPT